MKGKPKMKESLENQEVQTVDKLRPYLKGIIPTRLSREERQKLIEQLRENAKYIPEFLIEEHEKHVQEISKKPDGICRD
jgi:hypothetical protein